MHLLSGEACTVGCAAGAVDPSQTTSMLAGPRTRNRLLCPQPLFSSASCPGDGLLDCCRGGASRPLDRSVDQRGPLPLHMRTAVLMHPRRCEAGSRVPTGGGHVSNA